MIAVLCCRAAKAQSGVWLQTLRSQQCLLTARSDRLLSLTLRITLSEPGRRLLHCDKNNPRRQRSSLLTAARGLAMASQTGNRRSINFKDFDVFGFDLDHTIAKYKLVRLFEVVYTCVTEFLVNERGYDASIKDDLHKYKKFICKGLFLDVERGNILKLAPDGVILRATHGTELMTPDQVKKVYGESMLFEHTDAVKKNMRNGPPEYRFFENYFDCPGLVACARIIDLIDQQNGRQSEEEARKLYTKAWTDTLESLYSLYGPDNSAAGKGGYFQYVKKDPGAFVEECSGDIRRWLKSLRQDGKMVFLLTSSQIDYASVLLEVCLGKDWESYFDISLFRGRKPAFFNANNPFYMLENLAEGDVVSASDLKRNGCYSQGNLDDFNKFLASQLGKEQPKVLYFGDNICSDCYPSKYYAEWGTVLVLEEMDAEGYLCSDGTVPGHDHDAEDATNAPASKKKKLMEHSTLVTKEEMDFLLTDEFWAPFLIHPSEKPSTPLTMNTFWGDVISRYSDIAVPSLEYLAGVPLDHEFEAFTGKSGDATGFHPGRPSSLLP